MAEPAIVPHDQGEVISDTDRRRVSILADTEQIVVTESWYSVGERGPGPHVHHHHVDAFYVLAGEIVYGVGPQVATEVVAAAGTLVLVPPEVVHTFWNAGPAEARYLNFHAPNGGFAEFLRAARDGRRYAWDSDDPPADGGLPADDAVIRGPGEGELLVLAETGALLKAERADGGGRFAAVETTLAPGYAGPGPHVHASFVDSFYVLEGEMAVRVADERRTLEAGGFALAPPGTVHTFANETEMPVRMLNVLAPAGFEGFLRELAALGDRPDQAAVAALASRYDFRAAE
jgi:quercetin dioxygenase-like cupin family protein